MNISGGKVIEWIPIIHTPMIRPLQWRDKDDLIQDYYSYYDEAETDNPDIGIILYDSKPDTVNEIGWFSNLFREVQTGDAVAMVSEEDGHAVGICDVHRMRPGSEVSHAGVLGIAIKREYRGKGIGTELINACLEECREKFQMLILSVFSSNHTAISIYEKAGFVRHGVLPRSVLRKGRYYDEVLMHYQYKD